MKSFRQEGRRSPVLRKGPPGRPTEAADATDRVGMEAAASGGASGAQGAEIHDPSIGQGGRRIGGLRGEVVAIATALAFLTRLPLPRASPSAAAIERSVAWFPLVGALVGGLAALGLLAAAWLWPWPLPALVAVAIAVAVTGGFHEDGLADTADALAAGGDVERRLRVLDDPRIGAVGAVVLVLVLLGRVVALALLPLAAAAVALVAAHALARWTVPAMLWRLPYVRGESGVAAGLKRGATGGRLAVATILVGLVLGALVLADLELPAGGGGAPAAPTAADDERPAERSDVTASARRPNPPEESAPAAGSRAARPLAAPFPLSAALAAVAVALLVPLAAARFFRRRFGGVTGDLLGATCQAVELAVYLAVLAVVHRGAGP